MAACLRAGAKACFTSGMRFPCAVAVLGSCLWTACADDAGNAAPFIDSDAGTPRDAGAQHDSDAGEAVSFARDVQPIFARCVICHHPGGVIGVDLTHPFDSEKGIVGRRNSWAVEGHPSKYPYDVKPGSPDESFLIYKVSADPDPATFDVENNGDPMPTQVDRVTADELADVKQWISDGAKNDDFFNTKVAPVFGTAITLGSKVGKCTLCHYPDSSTGLNILAPFDDQVGLVNAKSLLSSKRRVLPGSPDDSFLVEKIAQDKPSAGEAMPLHYARLDASEVDTLRRWIADGAPNN